MAVHIVAQTPTHAEKVCVIGGDHHIHQHQYMNAVGDHGIPNRVFQGLRVLEQGYDRAKHEGVPFIINGDLTHNKNSMDPLVTSVLDKFFQTVEADDAIDIWLVPGNHEKPEKFQHVNTLEVFERGCVHLVRKPARIEINGTHLILCPFAYDHKNQAMVALGHKQNQHPAIFIGHFPVDGASLGRHTLSTSVKFEDFQPDHYTALLFNDIHKHQPIGTKGYHLGATMQNNFGESGYDVGWWLMSVSGAEVYLERVPVQAPQFFYTDDSEAADKLREQGHYARVRPQTVVKTMMEQQEQARIDFNMDDLDTTIENYIKFQVENGRFSPEDESELKRLAQVAMKGEA